MAPPVTNIPDIFSSCICFISVHRRMLLTNTIIINQQTHVFQYIQPHIIIFHQHVAVTSAWVSCKKQYKMYNKNHLTLYLISATKLLVTTHQIYKFAFLLKCSEMGCVYVVWWMCTVDSLKRSLLLCTTLTGCESTVHIC